MIHLSACPCSELFWPADCLARVHMPRESKNRMKSVHIPNTSAGTSFLDQLAGQLKIGRNAPYRRAVQRILQTIKKNYESGEYGSTTEAELAFRKLLEQEEENTNLIR